MSQMVCFMGSGAAHTNIMFRIAVAAGFAAACAISGGWKKWREFYPTILYVIIGDLAYNFVFYRYDLW